MVLTPKKSTSGWVLFFTGFPNGLLLYIIKFCLYHYSEKNIKYKIFLLITKKDYSGGFFILNDLKHCIYLIKCLKGLKILNLVLNLDWVFVN
uniref:Uncharacterized protein n=1 Tax=Lotharella vacuolata TaxID=74820 RepID=A0A0H5BL65_9EUKA|nr:hypothetical protein [Lotharella vacuolata]